MLRGQAGVCACESHQQGGEERGEGGGGEPRRTSQGLPSAIRSTRDSSSLAISVSSSNWKPRAFSAAWSDPGPSSCNHQQDGGHSVAGH